MEGGTIVEDAPPPVDTDVPLQLFLRFPSTSSSSSRLQALDIDASETGEHLLAHVKNMLTGEIDPASDSIQLFDKDRFIELKETLAHQQIETDSTITVKIVSSESAGQSHQPATANVTPHQ